MRESMHMKPEAALEAISKSLFPPPREQGGMMVSGDAYWNLAGVRVNLERAGADYVCIRTIESVQRQLMEVADVLRKVGLK
jgi:hypothetical protein